MSPITARPMLTPQTASSNSSTTALLGSVGNITGGVFAQQIDGLFLEPGLRRHVVVPTI